MWQRCVKGCPGKSNHVGVANSTGPTHRAKRQCFGLLRSWSKDQTVIAMGSGDTELYAACMATQQAMGTDSVARELGLRLDAMEVQVDANSAIGFIGREGLEKVRHLI